MHSIDFFLGEKLASLRKKRSLIQDELAEKLGISRQQIQKYEVGETRIPASLLYEAAVALHVNYEYFFEGLENIRVKGSEKSDTIDPIRHRPLNILLIEDSLSDEKLTRTAISKANDSINVYTAHTGVEALNLLHNTKQISVSPRPDVIFLDLNIPNKNGIEVLKAIKTDREIRDIPVVVITSSLSTEELQKVYQLGASGFVVKSFYPQEFFEIINKVVDYWTAMILSDM